MTSAYVYRAGYVAKLFTDQPSYGFDGGPEVRRRLRRLRASGIGKTFWLTIEVPGRFVVAATTMRPKPRSGYRTRSVWMCRPGDIKAIAEAMPFRCPRCWGGERPFTKFDSSRDVREEIAFGAPILCAECREARSTRVARQVEDLANLTNSLIKEMTHG